MFTLQQLLGKHDKFFDLLDASADEARGSVELLIQMLSSTDPARQLDEFVLTRRKEKRIAEQITEELCRTFVTPLEREDIEGLSSALYKIPKTAEKFGERLIIGRGHLPGCDFSKQAKLLEQATDTVVTMVKSLRGGSDIEKVKELNERLQYFEGEADKLMLELLRELYQGKPDAVRAIIQRDLYELLEKVIDRCRDVGNVVFQIVLKNS
ncbi:MAG TPA: DUF47 family protein [Verrucomicrobiae bacterium]|jgi:uncharacterized protein Yka (UPF0111/DUF47 family)